MKVEMMNNRHPDVEVEDSFRSYHHAEKTTDEPLVRVMALHALAYCERLFYLEEVEEIRVADANVYAGRRMHEELDPGAERYTMELASERLGIRGKLDCTRRKSGELVVYEHKKGKSKNGKEAWPSDRLQVLAYALLLADQTGEAIHETCVRYHADNRTITIPVAREEAEEEVLTWVERAKQLRASLARPPVTAAEKLCRSCSLTPVCLPEEERFAGGGTIVEKDSPKRLFPADLERIVHVVEQGSSIRKDGQQLIVYLPDGDKKPLPGMSIEAFVLHGNVQISTQAIHFCAARGIGVHWLSFGGHYVGGVSAGAGGVQRKNRQYRALQNPLLRAHLALRLAATKAENQLRYILRSTRSSPDGERPPEVEKSVTRMRQELAAMARIGRKLDEWNDSSSMGQDQRAASSAVPVDGESDGAIDAANSANLDSVSHDGLAHTKGTEPFTSEARDVKDDFAALIERVIEEIRGREGMVGREYFSALPFLLNVQEGELLSFKGRNRRPPKDPFNALLSFGYALLYKDCVAALMAVGLEPAAGFFHTPRSAAYPLALDLMELFRVIGWDVPLIGSVNRKQWRKEDFEITSHQVWLNPDGRRKAIQLYEARKQEKWKHPVLDYSLSYARTIELEARLLEKEWNGQPGLFARMRLR